MKFKSMNVKIIYNIRLSKYEWNLQYNNDNIIITTKIFIRYILPLLGYVFIKNDYRVSCRTETLLYNFKIKTTAVNLDNLVLVKEVVDRYDTSYLSSGMYLLKTITGSPSGLETLIYNFKIKTTVIIWIISIWQKKSWIGRM